MIEEDLLKNLKQYNYFIEKNPDALYSLDMYGNFTSGNEGLAKLLEVTLEEVLKTCFISFCAAEDYEKSYVYFQKALCGETCKFEAGFVTAKDKEIKMDITFLPMYIDGTIIGVYGIGKDRSLLEETQKLIEEKEMLLKANASFLKKISWEQSHILRAPLTRLMGLLDLFEMGPDEDFPTEEIWKHIRSSADELDSIVRKLVIKTDRIEEMIMEET